MWTVNGEHMLCNTQKLCATRQWCDMSMISATVHRHVSKLIKMFIMIINQWKSTTIIIISNHIDTNNKYISLPIAWWMCDRNFSFSRLPRSICDWYIHSRLVFCSQQQYLSFFPIDFNESFQLHTITQWIEWKRKNGEHNECFWLDIVIIRTTELSQLSTMNIMIHWNNVGAVVVLINPENVCSTNSHDSW